MKFSKQLVAAMVAAVLVSGVALATQNNRIIEAKKIITEQLVVGGSDVGASGTTITLSGVLAADDVTATDDVTVGDDLVVTGLATVGETLVVTGNLTADEVLTNVPAAQVVTAAATITADACGSVKLISSAAPVTTGTTNTFTAPAAGNEGCQMDVCNVNASDAVTLDNNALFQSEGGADVVLAGLECVRVVSTGASGVWIQTTPKHANHA